MRSFQGICWLVSSRGGGGGWLAGGGISEDVGVKHCVHTKPSVVRTSELATLNASAMAAARRSGWARSPAGAGATLLKAAPAEGEVQVAERQW